MKKTRQVRKALEYNPMPSNIQESCINKIVTHIQTNNDNGSVHSVEAYAGSGKTTTLIHLLIRLNNTGVIKSDEKVIFLIFNNGIKEEVENKLKSVKFPITTRFHVKTYMGYLMSKSSLYSMYPHTKFEFDYQHKGKSCINDIRHNIGKLAIKLLQVVESTLTSFCISIDDEISVKHINKNKIHNLPNHEEFSNENIVNQAKYLWSIYIDPKSHLLLNMEKALKLLHLHKIKCPYKYIICDEAQDIPDVLWDWLNNQTHCHRVFVGDIYQTINTWIPGVRRAFELQKEWDTKSFLNETMRLPKNVSQFVNALLYKMNDYNKATPPKLISFKQNYHMNFYKNIDSVILEQSNNYTILCRSRLTLLQVLVQLPESVHESFNINIHSKTDLCNVLQKYKDISNLMNNKLSCIIDPLIKQYASIDELIYYHNEYKGVYNYVKNNEQFLYNISDKAHYVLNKIHDVNISTITLSTLHTQKGREFENVILGNDFNLVSFEEYCILYTAITRACTNIWIPNILMDIWNIKYSVEFIEYSYLRYKKYKEIKTSVPLSINKRIRIRIPTIAEFEHAEKHNYRIPLELIYPS